MEKLINLKEYLNFGGKLKKLDYSKVFLDSGGIDDKHSIIKIEEKGFNVHGDPLYFVYFTENPKIGKSYSGHWIKINVEVKLAEKYK